MAKKKTEVQLDFKANVSEFDKSIKEMNSDINLLNNQLKLNATQLKGNSNDVDLLTKRQDLLTTELQKSTQKVDDTNKKLIEAKKIFGDNSQEVRNLTNDLLKAQNQEQAIKNELSSVDTQINKVTNSVNDLDNACDNVDDGFTVMKGALADLTSNAIQGAISGVSGLVDSLFELPEATEEYRSMMGKLEGASQTFGYEMDFVSNQFDTFYSYLGDNQAATNAITNLMGLGIETDKVSRLAEGAIGVWASYGDSIPIESLTESINETIQVGKVTGTMADTINWAKVSNEEFAFSLGEGSEAQKAFNKAINEGASNEDAFSAALAATSSQQERANIVANFLNNTYGSSKATYDSLNASLLETNSSENQLQQTQAQIAETITPLQNKFMDLKAQGLELLVPILENVVDGLFDFGDWCKNNESTLQTIGIIFGSVATAVFLVHGAVGAYNIIMSIYTAITTGASLSTTALGGAIALLTSPITIAIAIIGALIAVGVLLWKNWDTVVEKAGELKENVFKKFTDLKDGIVNVFKGIGNTLKNLFKFNIDLPKIKMPHFSIKPKGWEIGDLMKGKIPKLGIDWYAKGAVFTKPTIFNTNNGSKGVAEAGSEAVLPLSILDEKIQNSMSLVLDDLTFDENAFGVDNIVSNNVNNSLISAKLDRACELLEKIVDKDWSLYADTTKLAEATSSANDQITGEIIELRERGLEI